MVGAPKQLTDLNRIEAAVRVKCRVCGRAIDRALDDVIAEVRELGGSTSWPEFLRGMNCPHHDCGSDQLSALALPFTAGARRPVGYGPIIINLALKILREACDRRRGEPRATLEVRLALHVLRKFVTRKELLTGFWESVAEAPDHTWSGYHQHYRWIANDLAAGGHQVWTENRP